MTTPLFKTLKKKVLSGYEITREEAIQHLIETLQEHCNAADEIRKKIHGNNFDFCSIVNASSEI